MNPQGFRSLLRRPARGRRSRPTLVPVLGLALAAAATAAEDEADERVRSVASRLPAAASNADPFPLVTVIDRDDLELSGAKSVEDLVLRRFGNNLFGLYRPLVVGSGGVAFLVNGRPVSDFIVDLDTLPLSAVERIELLNGTAAGLHGGHAVAGAINVVLGRDYEGTEVRVGTDRPDTAGGDAEHGSARWGGRVGRGHLTIGVDAIRRKEVRDADRDYSRTAFVTGGPILGTTGVSPSGNTIEFTVDPGEGEKKLGRYGILGECSEDVYTGPLTLPAGLGSVCGYAYADSKWLDGYGGRERGALFLAADHPLGERADLHVDARAALGESDFRYAPSVGTFEYTLPADVRNRLAEEHGTVPANIEDEATLNHRFVAHGDRDWQTDVEEYDLALGVRGRFAGGVGHDTVLRLYRYDYLEKGGTFVSEPLIEEAIGDGRYDAANPLDPDLDAFPGHWDTVRETSVRLEHEIVADHKSARVVFDGASFAADPGGFRWAAGAELAREKYRNVHEHRDRRGNFIPTADALGSAGSSAVGKRRRWSAFLEAAVPLRDDWEVGFAARHDDHDDVGPTYAFQAMNRYRPSEALALRSRWSKSEVAPHFFDLHQYDALSYPAVLDPKDPSCSRESCQVEYAVVGNPKLEPEDATSMSTGAAVDLGAASFSFDWFRIRTSGAPGALSAQLIVDLDAAGKSLPPGSAVMRDSSGTSIDRITSRKLNIRETDVIGFDLRAGTGWKVGGADVALDARLLQVTRNEVLVNGEPEPGYFPRHRFHGSLRFTEGPLNVLWSLSAISGYSNVRGTGRYEGWAGHDVAVRWSDPFGIEGLGLTAGVLNLGDRGPPTNSADPDDQDLRLDNVLGRTLFLSARMSFGT